MDDDPVSRAERAEAALAQGREDQRRLDRAPKALSWAFLRKLPTWRDRWETIRWAGTEPFFRRLIGFSVYERWLKDRLRDAEMQVASLAGQVVQLRREVAKMRAADLNSVLPDADRLTLAQLEDRVRALEAQADAR